MFQVFHIWLIIILLWSRVGNVIILDLSQDFQILFPPGQFKKNHKKNRKKRKKTKHFSVKILARFWFMWIFFSVFTLVGLVVLKKV